jgi:7,8-dihydroneopterin aldolase/epimerase/oxygenase
MAKIYSKLQLNHIELTLHLGWPSEERLQKQTILVDILLKFTEPPAACITDQLNDTYCYHSLIETIVKQTESREFRLIEHAAASIYQLVKAELPEVQHIRVVVHKNLAAVGLSGKAAFEYGD